MKLLVISLLSLVLASFQCSPDRYTNAYRGRLENIPNCGAPVVKILSGDLSQIQHETNWQHPGTGENFSNVFVVTNYCDFQDKNIMPEEEFCFVLQPSMRSQSCIICMALFPAPSKNNIIKIIAEKNCQ